MSIIQQLEDLKEWSQDSTRYERRLNFRGGQLVQPGPGRQGYAGKPQESTTTSWKKKYKIKAFDEVADLFLKTYAEDDIDHIYKVAGKLDDKMRFVANDSELLQYISKQSGLSENQISNMLEDKVAHADLMADIKTQEGKAHHMKGKKKLDTRMKNWLMKNSEKYADPDRFKKSFARVFGKNNYILKGIKADKRAASMLPLGDDFIKTFISDKIKNPVDHSFSSQQLDDMFKSLIYNNNKTVNAKVRKTFLDLIPESRVSKGEHIDIYRVLKDNKFLRKFAINEGLTGPIGRVIMKDLGDDLSKKIKLFQKPYMGTYDLINYLENHVDEAYKPMFKEAKQAVSSAQMNKWPDAKKHLDEGLTIMWDHKIPSSLIEAGYADDLEFIKANPTSKEFNINIKNKQFDKPMNKLVRQFEQAKTLDEKVNIHKKMVAKKDAFSEKYGNYLDEVKITMDEKGKLKFASDAPVITKETDVVKMLKTSLGQEKFPTMGGKDQIKFLKEAGFKIDKCLKLAKGGSPDQCIRGVIQEAAEDVKKGKPGAEEKFKKSGRRLGLLFGWLDVPLELSFAAPHLLMGDVQAAKRATTFGLAGWGKVDLDNVDDPEARKYLKHRKDTEDWINNWEKHYYYSEKLKNLPDDASGALRKDIEARVNKRASNMESIAQNYDGYDRSGSENENWAYNPEEMAGKSAAKNWIDTKVETDLDKQLAETHGLHGDPFLLDLASPYADVEKEKLRASPKDLESFIETKGQDFWGNPEGWWFYKPLKQEEAEAHGVGNLYDDYYMGASEGKDIRDSYSSIPLDYASQLGALEAKETREGLEALRYNPLSEMYFAGGGIAGIRRPWAIPPESGPDPQGLASMNNYVIKRTG